MQHQCMTDNYRNVLWCRNCASRKLCMTNVDLAIISSRIRMIRITKFNVKSNYNHIIVKLFGGK